MAVATAKTAQVLSRYKDQFKDAKTGELVDYVQARVLDVETGDLLVVSGKTQDDLAALVPGKKIENFQYEIKDTTTIRALKVSLAGAAAPSTRVNF